MIVKTLQHCLEPYVQKAIQLPFNQKLFAGTLSPEQFNHYVKHDKPYLKQFFSSLSEVATRFPADDRQFLQRLSERTRATELALHTHFIPTQAHQSNLQFKPSPNATLCQYIAYMKRMAATPLHPAASLSLFIPCLHVYRRIGEEMNVHVRRDNHHPYLAWIKTYSGANFVASTDQLFCLIDKYYDNHPQLEQLMITICQQCADYEVQFFEQLDDNKPVQQTHFRFFYNTNSSTTHWRSEQNNRLLSKLAALSEVQGEAERRTAVYTSVHEDSSTVSTKQFANAVGFRKRSNAMPTPNNESNPRHDHRPNQPPAYKHT